VPEGPQGNAIIEAVNAMVERLILAPWNSSPEPYAGPLISVKAAEAALKALQDRIEMGARVIRASGPVGNLPGAFVSPAIIDVTGVDVPDEEMFAPFLSVTRVSSFDAALAEANATRYGLSAGLVSDDPANWDRFIRRIRAGVVNFNRPTTGAAGDMPFGGLGSSGNHRPSAYYAADYCAWVEPCIDRGVCASINTPSGDALAQDPDSARMPKEGPARPCRQRGPPVTTASRASATLAPRHSRHKPDRHSRWESR
jgi:succinylglutamic semialdehyde dehydrogenase